MCTGHEVRTCVILSIACIRAISAEEPKRVDLCVLFADPTRYDGVMISVRGEIVSGHREGGPWVSAEDCKNHIDVNGHRFANLIAMTGTQDKGLRLHAVSFTIDRAARDAYKGALRRVDRRTEIVRAIVIGLFETRVPLTALTPENGFGDQNGAPVQILVKTIEAITVESRRSGLHAPDRRPGTAPQLREK
jgi:hypothetical protein